MQIRDNVKANDTVQTNGEYGLPDDFERKQGGEEEEVEERRVVHQDERRLVLHELVPFTLLADMDLRIEQQKHFETERQCAD